MLLCDPLREKVYVAFCNVSFLADETWVDTNSSEYTRRNQEILKSLQSQSSSDTFLGSESELSHQPILIRRGSWSRVKGGGALNKSHPMRSNNEILPRTRTVRHVIPNSRLAIYGNFPYDEKREFFYTICETDSSSALMTSAEFAVTGAEPWMLPEVNYYFNIHMRCIQKRLNQSLKPNKIEMRKCVTYGGLNPFWQSSKRSSVRNSPVYGKPNSSPISSQPAYQYYLPSYVNTDSFSPSYHLTCQNRKNTQESSKRCQKQLGKRYPFLNVGVSEIRPKLKPRTYQVENNLVSCHLSPFLSVTNGETRSFITQQPANYFYNQMRSILPNIYANSNPLQNPSFLNRDTSAIPQNKRNRYIIPKSNSSEKVAVALTEVKTWLRKVYPKRNLELKKIKKTDVHPFTFEFQNKRDDGNTLHEESGNDDIIAKQTLGVDVEECFADLERQAMEQYQCSSENLLKSPLTPSEEKFQDLEREALEQYCMNETKGDHGRFEPEPDLAKSNILCSPKPTSSKRKSFFLRPDSSDSFFLLGASNEGIASPWNKKQSHHNKKSDEKNLPSCTKSIEYENRAPPSERLSLQSGKTKSGATRERYIHNMYATIVERKHSNLGSSTKASRLSIAIITKTMPKRGDCGDSNFNSNSSVYLLRKPCWN